jgi:hypothetical protein
MAVMGVVGTGAVGTGIAVTFSPSSLTLSSVPSPSDVRRERAEEYSKPNCAVYLHN